MLRKTGEDNEHNESNTLGDVANLLKHDQADFSGLITHELPLKDFGTGLAAIRNGEAMKVVLYPEQ